METIYDEIEFIVADNHEAVRDLVRTVRKARLKATVKLTFEFTILLVICYGIIIFPLPGDILIYFGKIILLYHMGRTLISVFEDIIKHIGTYDGDRMFPGTIYGFDGSQEEVYSTSDQATIISRCILGEKRYSELIFLTLEGDNFVLVTFDIEYVKKQLAIN